MHSNSSFVESFHGAKSTPAYTPARNYRKAAVRTAALTAVATVCAFTARSSMAADSVVTGISNNSADVKVTSVGNSTFLDLAGVTPGDPNQPGFSVFGIVDIPTSAFVAPVGQSLTGTLASNSATFTAYDGTPFHQAAGAGFNIYLETDNTTSIATTSALRYDPTKGPEGFDASTFAAGSSLYLLGSGIYNPNTGAPLSYSITIPTGAATSFVNSQLASPTGNLRLVLGVNQSTATSPTVENDIDFVGSATSTNAPRLALDLSTVNNGGRALTFNGVTAGDLNFSTSASDQNMLNGATVTSFNDGDGVTFPTGQTGTVTVAAGGVKPAALTFTNTSGTYTLQGGPIGDASTGATGITVSGAGGTVVLASPNTYSGGTLVTAGNLEVAGDSSLGAAGTGITLQGGALTALGNISPAAGSERNVTLNSAGTIDSGSHAVTLGALNGAFGAPITINGSAGGSVKFAGNFNLNGNAGTATVNSGATLILAQPPTATGRAVTNANVTNFITPAAANSFAGDLVIASGLRLNVLGNNSIAGGGKVYIDATGALLSNSGGSAAAPVTSSISNNIVLNRNNVGGNGQGFGFTANFGSNGGNTVGTGTTASVAFANILTISGVISGNSDVNFGGAYNADSADGVASGSGIVYLTSQNAYTGATRISGGNFVDAGNPSATPAQPASVNSWGTVRLGIDNALPTTTSLTFGSTSSDVATILAAGLLDLYGHSQTVTSLAVGTTGAVGGIANFSNISGGNGQAGNLIIKGSANTVFTAPIGIQTNGFDGTGNVITGNSNIILTLATGNTGTLELTAGNTYTGGTNINGGTLIVSTNSSDGSGVGTGPVANNATFIVQGDGNLGTDGNATPSSITGTGSTTVGAGSHLTTGFIRQGGLTVNGTTVLTPQSVPRNNTATVSIVNSLTMGASGLFDLSNHDLIVHNGNLTQIKNSIQSGYNGGLWTGTTGITSSTAAAATSPKTALGYGSISGSFDGQTVTATDVVVKYTLIGDTDLNGSVAFTDLLTLAQHYQGTSTTWTTGDFNYDGSTNFTDLLGLAQNYQKSLALTGQQITQLDSAGGPTFAAAFAQAEAQAAVPEPGTLSLLVVGSLGLLGRKRRSA